MPFAALIPAAIAAAGALTNIISSNSAEAKQRKYQLAMQRQTEQNAQREAIKQALGARSFGVQPHPIAPDTSTERTIGTLANVAGQAASSYLGSQGTESSPQPQGAFNDPSEAIRRRLQNSYDPYGGSRVS